MVTIASRSRRPEVGLHGASLFDPVAFLLYQAVVPSNYLRKTGGQS